MPIHGVIANQITTVELVLTPNQLIEFGQSPFITGSLTANAAGNIYVVSGGGPYYYEIEWYKNDVFQGYTMVWDYGDYLLGPGYITVEAGDTIKFRVSGEQYSEFTFMLNRDAEDGFTLCSIHVFME